MASAENSSTPQASAAPTGVQPAAPSKSSAVQPADGAVKPLPPPRQPPSPDRIAGRIRFLDGLLIAFLLAFAFLGALFTAHNSDFLLHAAAGRLIIAHGDLRPMLGVDPFAFTTHGAYWANTSWLYDIVVYVFYDKVPFGDTILIVLKALMIAALAELMLRTAREPGRPLWVPVCCVGLAILTLSPRALLQPTAISFFFLGLTYWLVHLPRRWRTQAEAGEAKPARRPNLPYWLIPPLCLLWVNLDGWFLLGPITVALYLLGETIQDWLASSDRRRSSRWAPGEQRTLVWVLLASIAACFINPHHYHAFALPSSLGLFDSAPVLAHDEQFEALFCSPLESFYFHPQIGLTAAGLAFFPLLLLGLVSFAAAQWVGRWSWERAIVWTGFLALACFRAGLIPFFAVVAGPIASLNFLDWAATRPAAARQIRPLPLSFCIFMWLIAGLNLLSAAGLLVGGLWSGGDRGLALAAGVDGLIAALFVTVGRAGSWAVAGRILTALLGAVLLFATVPGWLQAQQPPPWQWRRIGWTMEPDPAMVRVTDRIKYWQKHAGLEHGVRWLNDSAAALPFLAWYCPDELGCFDAVRLSLYDAQTIRDNRQIRESLSDAKAGDFGKPDPRWRNLMRSFEAHFLICYTPYPLRESSPLRTMLRSPDEWVLLYVDGPAAVFGWRDPAKKDEMAAQFSRCQVPMEQEAFGAAAVPAPPPNDNPAPAWWAVLWTPETPRPPEVDEAGIQRLRFESLQLVWRQRNEKDWNGRWDELKRGMAADAARGYFGAAFSPYGPFQFSFLQAQATVWQLSQPQPPLPSLPPKEGEELLLAQARKLFDYGPPASLYLGIRAARRALALKPDEAQAHLFLAHAYFLLMAETRDGVDTAMVGYPPGNASYPLLLRQIQIKTALRRALQIDPKNKLGLLLSREIYAETGYHDLASQYTQQLADALAEEGDDVTALRKSADAMAKEVQQQTEFWRVQTANKRPLDKVQLAVQKGLPLLALDELEKIDWIAFDDNDKSKLPLQLEEFNLLMQTGQVDDVAGELKEDEENLRQKLRFDPAVGLPAYEWLRVQAAAANGDYADADHWLAEIEKQMQADLGPLQQVMTARLAANLFLRHASLATAPVLTSESIVDDLREAMLMEQDQTTISVGEGLVADTETVRGWLALEAGNIPQAEAHITTALKLPRSANDLALDKFFNLPATDQLNFRARLLAELCRERLNAGK
ncbi:MAG TPA: hypothetical protein VMS17_03940 [Gemmataceae bacterium]|nr:hypothetical protein [Gemmataceae bacterium]